MTNKRILRAQLRGSLDGYEWARADHAARFAAYRLHQIRRASIRARLSKKREELEAAIEAARADGLAAIRRAWQIQDAFGDKISRI